jgi:nucleoside-diphosphate-sugar epimerase
MRVFVAGASGAIGRRLVPQLLEAGHEVVGTHKSTEGGDALQRLGATPVRLDLLDAEAVRAAVAAHRPEAIVHEATALGDAVWGRNFDKVFEQTNALRTRGTDALLAAAWDVGVGRFVAQSFASYRYLRQGGPVKTEDDPLDSHVPANAKRSFEAMAYLDSTVVEAGGIILRYGAFYGASNDGLIEPIRNRQYPIIGNGNGITSWIHLDDAAAATVLALEKRGPALYNIVDDEPAAVREWLPVAARALGARPPRRFPAWLARMVAGEAAVVMGTDARGASNALAKRELGWTLRYPSWRTGFAATYSTAAVPDGATRRPVRRHAAT